MKRVVLTGAECTGKSTLATALSGYYGEPWSPEYVREYANLIDRELSVHDLDSIAKGQIQTEDAPLPQAKRLIVHDTNLLSSILYANHYFNTTLEWVNERFLERDYTLYLLCSPSGIKWEADPGQRDSPEAQAVLHAKFRESLDTLKLPYFELRGDTTIRFGEAVKAINAVL